MLLPLKIAASILQWNARDSFATNFKGNENFLKMNTINLYL